MKIANTHEKISVLKVLIIVARKTLISDCIINYIPDAITGALYDMGIWNETHVSIDDPLAPFGGQKQPISKCSNDCMPGYKKIAQVGVFHS